MAKKLPSVETRASWQAYRKKWEKGPIKQGIYGAKSKKWGFFYKIVAILYKLVKKTFLIKRLQKNAQNPKLTYADFVLKDLPTSFAGYTILHITDLHLDAQKGLSKRVSDKIAHLKVDLVIMTGDYQDAFELDPNENKEALKTLFKVLNAKDGIVCTLGNHDSYKAAAMLESLGAKVLINETMRIDRGGESLFLTGLDDVHYFFSDSSLSALDAKVDGFKILAVHSPEIYKYAEKSGYKLYFAGHTHGGQVCLPFGIPLVTHARVKRRMVRGKWRFKRLMGYTNRGAGTSGFPMRLNCPGEVLLARLRN